MNRVVELLASKSRNLPVRRYVLLLACLLVVGCSSNAERIDALARAASLEHHVLELNSFRSVIYMKPRLTPDQPLVVFIEGDGRPWRAGIEPSVDPTTANPIALELLTRTPRAAAYVSRPCYQDVKSTGCTPALWTGARYSEEVVEIMTRALQEIVRRSNASETIIVGHSGGGTLAVLIAERMPGVSAVVTIAANLDIDAWTTHHGYLALSESLNPARSTLNHPWREIHIAGRDDQIVPPESAAAYFERYPSATRWVLDGHSHVCCWLEQWPVLWDRIEHELNRDE